MALVPLAVLLVAGCADSDSSGSNKGGSQSNASVEKYVKAGDDALSDGDRKKAVQAYTKAINLDPECYKAYLKRGMVHNESGDDNSALKDFDTAIELDPRDSSFPYEQRAQIYRKQGKRSQAEADDETAAAIRNKEWDKLPEKRKQFEDKRRKR